jgi:hypothetical protein
MSRPRIDYAVGHSQGAVVDTYQNAIFSQLEPIRIAMEAIIEEPSHFNYLTL